MSTKPILRKPWKPPFLSDIEWTTLKWTVYGFIVVFFGTVMIAGIYAGVTS